MPAPPRIWRIILLKLLYNASSNPISALTRLVPNEFALRPDLRRMIVILREELLEIMAAMGWNLRDDFDPAAFPASKDRSAIRPSMLQDVEQARPTEVEAILGQMVRFAADLGIAAPTLATVTALMRGLDAALAATSNP
ncbi:MULTISPECIES: ketopantoate reductase family protein [unclassified Sphingobium]|uniref:ketopantoate reductase family protein n=1 Tax=unclassified Sphingobium TaxID=2611147 RepID=UPI001E5CB1DE|nr:MULTISPECIES: ketopantoate reductase C-terminal domain-containing protein [unclassified Sphingobium]